MEDGGVGGWGDTGACWRFWNFWSSPVVSGLGLVSGVSDGVGVRMGDFGGDGSCLLCSCTGDDVCWSFFRRFDCLCCASNSACVSVNVCVCVCVCVSDCV